MPEREARTVVGWKYDQASEQAVVTGTERVSAKSVQAAKDANSAAVQFNTAAQAAAALGLNAEQMAQLGLKAETLANSEATAAQNQLVVEKQITAEQEKQLAANEKAARGNSLGIGGADGKLSSGFGTLRAAGSAFANLGGGQGVTQIASIVGLGVELGALGLVAGGAAIVLKQLTAEQERQTKVYEARLDVERSVARDVADLTTQEVQDRLRAAQQRLEIDRDVANQQTANSLLYFNSLIGDGLRMQGAIVGLDATYNAFQGALAKNAVAIAADEAEIAALTNALAEGKTAAANARAAEELLAKQRAEFSTYVAGIVKIETDAQTRQFALRVEIDQLTAEQREEKLAQDQRELDLINNRLRQGNLTIEAEANLRERQGELTEAILFTSEVTDTYADQQARLAANIQAVTDQTDAYFAALKSEETIRDRIADINSKIADIQLDRDTKILELERDRDERIAQIVAEGGDRRGEITADGEERRRDIIADSAEKIARITRDSGRALYNLVAQRDALGHALEKLRAADALADEKTAQGKSLDQQKKGESKALDQQGKAQDKQLDQARRGFERSQQAAFDNANRQLTSQFRAYEQERVALVNQQIATQSIANWGSNGRRIIETQLWQDINAVAVTWAANTVNSLRSILGVGGGSGGSGGGSGVIGIAQFNRQFDRRFAQTIDPQGRFG